MGEVGRTVGGTVGGSSVGGSSVEGKTVSRVDPGVAGARG
jgi:hypothetical protein